ncbi:MAG TPA: phage virion morphogenesis protein [Candidatus Wunengus sp. YC60]|uniref:phage virion morphogenesis protein n=1 Tax=Candidatus Wunengus sp. YC60 TaxID=3367697 RepID=UPI004024B824
MITIDIKDDGVKALLNRLSAKMVNMIPAMRQIAGILHDAIIENFEQEGRPRWQELAESTKKQRAEKGHWPGKMLQISQGGLKSSCLPGSDAHAAWVSTNKDYAGPQQFGTKPYIIKPKTKPYLKFKIGDNWVVKKEIHHPGLKPRPFFKLTDGDMEKIRWKMMAYWMEGNI